MSFVFIALISLGASFLTLFSGFGLGTLLLPVFALFMPMEMAVAATAVVHAANNVLKAGLLGRLAEKKIVLIFGLPAIGAAYFGAKLLTSLSEMPTIFSYSLFGKVAIVTPLKLILGILILGFALFELLPKFQKLSFNQKWLPIGGILSGFFGGLSGHQGALRSAFLSKIDIAPQAFVGTNAVIGLMVDLIRIFVYGTMFAQFNFVMLTDTMEGKMILTGVFAAFLGILLGKKFLHKVTMEAIQNITGGLLLLIGILLTTGILG